MSRLAPETPRRESLHPWHGYHRATPTEAFPLDEIILGLMGTKEEGNPLHMEVDRGGGT